MGLSDLISSLAARRPCCYLVEAPEGQVIRRAVEAALDRRGWRCADSPAHADALVIAGALPADLQSAAEVLWSQLPGPRVRLQLTDADDVEDALDSLPYRLVNRTAHAKDAAARGDEARRWIDDDADADEGHDSHGSQDSHEEHDHSMSPSGIPLAEGAEDRDGLEMDYLTHPWGPLLDRWPGDLELKLTLHGDTVASAESRWWSAIDPVGTHVDVWDAVATTLSLLREDRSARSARGVRDGGGDPDPILERLRLLGRMGALPASAVDALLALTGDDPTADRDLVDPADLVTGHDLADARLLVAAHAPLLKRENTKSPAPARAADPEGGCDG